MYHEPGLRLYERLQHVLPGGPWQAFLSNSGAEAVEAVGQARAGRDRPAGHPRVPRRLPRPDGADDGPHDGQGRRTAAAFEPLPGSVYHTPFPYCYRAAGGPHDPSSLHLRLGGAARPDVPPDHLPGQVAAIIIEPVLGEGGYVVPPPAFLPRLREITRQHGILLIADEVQTGFGRTGEMFAVEHWDVEPDILVMAKGIASGLPLSGILARPEIMARWKPGTHGGTYGGNVVSCAAANATLDVIEDEGLVANARARGAQFLAGLRELQADHPAIGDVRGLGLHGRAGVRQAGRG